MLKEVVLRGKKARENARVVEDETPSVGESLKTLLLRDGDGYENEVITTERVTVKPHLRETRHEGRNGATQKVCRKLLGAGVVAIVIAKELLIGSER